MGNITKNKQCRKTLCKMVKQAFGQERELVAFKEMPEGFCNIAYELTLDGNDRVILKVGPQRDIRMMSCERGMMRTEVNAMKLASQKGLWGVPKVYYYDDTREICSGEYFMMEKLDGESYHITKIGMAEKKQKEIDAEIGHYLYELNQIQGKRFGHFWMEEYQKDNWFDAFYAMINGVIEDGISVSVPIGVPYEEVLKVLKKHKEHFKEVIKPQLIHFDSWDGNIFVKDEKLVGMIDWERAMWAEGLMEDRFRMHSVKKGFLEGYGVDSLTESQQIRCMWYDVYLYIIMMIEGTFRYYETNDQDNWIHGLFEQVWGDLSKK